MATQLYYSPFVPAFSNIGIPLAESKLYFYYSQTTTLAPIYSDAAQTIPLTNPVVANLAGKYPDIYLDSAITYRVVQTDKLNTPIGDAVDPYLPGRALKGDPGANVLSIGTFSIANTLSIPVGTDLVQTSGYASSGYGSAKYTYDATVNSTYVTANPRTSFLSANGRGFKLAEPFLNVQQTGAKGDGTTDDTVAIQAAFDYMASIGGGTVFLAPNSDYRVTTTLRIPGFVTLEGGGAVRYPYVGTKGTRIVADFPEGQKLKWIIEANTKKNTTGFPYYAYNEQVTGALSSCVPAYNISIRNLTITAINSIPFGGLRIHGAPGASVAGVGITNVGTGFLLNYAFDCDIDLHSMGKYTGAAIWDDVNACALKIYCAQDQTGGVYPKTIPTEYRLPFMVSLDGALVGAFGLSTNAHTSAAIGLLMGSSASLCVNNDLRLTTERYSRGMMLLNVGGLEITRYYCEGSTNDVDFALVSANTNNSHVRALHAFMSGTGTLVDLGAAFSMSLTPGGIINPSTFGTGPFGGDGSLLIVHESRPHPTGLLQPSPPRVNIYYPDLSGAWIDFPAAAGGWTNNGTYKPQYRLSRHRIELRGFATGGPTGSTAIWTLPAGFRPSQLHNVAGGFGSSFSVDTDGTMKIATGSVFGLDGVSIPLA